MLVLASTDNIQVITSSANALDTAAAFADNTAAAFTPGREVHAIVAAATTTIVTAPAATTTRNVSSLSLFARGGANTIQVQTTGGTTVQYGSIALAAGERLEYENGKGWSVYDPSGQFKQSIAAGAGSIALTSLATQAANTEVGNWTAGVASPTANAVGTNTVVGRVAGNIVAAALVNAQVTANTLTYASIAQPAANTMPANATAGAANLADLAVGTNTVVGRVAGNIVAAALVNAQITANTITAASQAQMATFTVKGNNTTATANEIDTTASQHAEYTAGGLLTQTTAQLQTASVTNVTPGAYTIPANFAVAGSEYLCEALMFSGRGATLTATNLIVELLVAGAVVRTLTIAINVGASFNGAIKVEGRVTVRTAGAGGTIETSLYSMDTVTNAAPALTTNPAPTGVAVATSALNTTISNTLELRARLSAATATVYVQALHMTIEKVR